MESHDKDFSAEFSDNIENEGYGAVYYNGNLNQEWNVFHPSKIKSATDNAGTFDGTNDDIRL